MRYLKIKLFIVAMFLFAAAPAFASYSYDFVVNTSSLVGQSGYIDLELNPVGNAGTANAVISNFVSDATLGVVSPTGGVSGTLPSAVTITSTAQSALNDYFQAVTFGNTISFYVTLNGANQNTFTLSFFGSDGATPLLTNNLTDGFATTIEMASTGPIVANFSNQVTAQSTVPIPGAIWLLGSGLAGLFGLKRKYLG